MSKKRVVNDTSLYGVFKKIFKFGFWFVITLILLNILFALFGSEVVLPDSVAVIHVKGVIVSEGEESFFNTVASAETIVSQIKDAEENPNIKALLFEINSPGGSAVASDQIAQKVKQSEKPTMALIKEVGASGGYWIASSTDTIVANRMSITGSIGVIASYLDFSGLLDDHNITYQRLVAGMYKDIGSPFKHMTEEEKALFQEQLDQVHEYFILEIAENRNISIEDVRDISTGMFYLGSRAQELGLVDYLGNKEDAVDILEEQLGVEEVHLKEYSSEKSFLDILSAKASEQFYYIGLGIGAVFDKDTELKIII